MGKATGASPQLVQDSVHAGTHALRRRARGGGVCLRGWVVKSDRAMLRQACGAFRGAVLAHMRLPPHSLVRAPRPRGGRGAQHRVLVCLCLSDRGGALRLVRVQLQSCGAATGAYLDKAAVTDRVVTVLKNFSKVDAAKVRWLEGRAWRPGPRGGGTPHRLQDLVAQPALRSAQRVGAYNQQPGALNV